MAKLRNIERLDAKRAAKQRQVDWLTDWLSEWVTEAKLQVMDIFWVREQQEISIEMETFFALS